MDKREKRGVFRRTKMKDLKVGIVGLGFMARKVHLPVLIGLEEVEISTVVDVDRTKLNYVTSRYAGVKGFNNTEDAVKEKHLDCAFVLTPGDMHLAPTIALLKNGIDVFCEKPLAMNLEDVEKMVSTAANEKRILMVGFNRRFTPVYQKAKKVFDNRKIESLFIEKTGGKLKEHTLHIIDVMRWFCGESKNIKAFGQFDMSGQEKTVAALIEFDSGAIGIFHTNCHSGKWIERMEVNGGDYTAVVEAPHFTVISSKKEQQELYLPDANTFYMSYAEKFGYKQEVMHFLDCVRTGKKPLTSGEDAIKSHGLAHKILSICKNYN